MDDVRIGRAIRALRRRRGWRQVDLGTIARVAQSTVSLVERGHLDGVSLRTLRGLLAALDARLVMQVSWRAGELDRLLDQGHAQLGGQLATALRMLGWLAEVEVSYSEFGERGSIDLLAYHAERGSLLVIEVKTELGSGEQVLRKLDEKARLAPRIARDRFGWEAGSPSRLLAIAGSATNRRRIAASAAYFDAALPARTVAVRRWLRRPAGTIAGCLFLAFSDGSVAIQKRGGRSRIRVPSRPRAGLRRERGVAA